MRIMPSHLKLSVLDQSPATQDKTQDHAIRESLALAKHCDALGYHRYWVSEHHNSASIVGTAPEVLMAAIAATTSRIRVGSAGVMLPHYSTLKVAEQFRVLEAIAPGRIDLGVGRAPGSDRTTAMALNPDANAAENFPTQVQELGLWLRGEALPPGHPFTRILKARRPRRSGSSAAPITGRSSRRTSGFRMRTRISSPTGAAPRRRSRSIGATSAPASITPSRWPPSASGRWQPIPRPMRGTC
jgi:luciferase family oxidoreductase group 1